MKSVKMDINEFISSLKRIETIDRWTFELFKIKCSKNKASYVASLADLQSDEIVKNTVFDVLRKYTDCEKTWSLDDYAGEFVNDRVYQIHYDSPLISESFNSLVSSFERPEVEDKKISLPYSGYSMVSSIDGVRVMLISMHPPVKILKNKFVLSKGNVFKELKSLVLTLRDDIDVLIIGDDVFFFSALGEKLFNMERSLKTNCEKRINEIINTEIVADADKFRHTAVKGVNPRRFVSFNSMKLKALANVDRRKEIAAKFNLNISEEDKIDTSDEVKACRLIKFLCDKAMLDPIEDFPVEVSAAKSWT